jgi:hypothetical protein
MGAEPDLSDMESEFLRAARELSTRQREVYQLVTQALKTDPYKYWIEERLSRYPIGFFERLKRRFILRNFEQRGMTRGGECQ